MSYLIKLFLLGLRIFRIPRLNSATGKLEVNGVALDLYEFTKTEFLSKASSDFSGVAVRVTNLHQDSRGVGGVDFIGGPSWTLLSDQIYYATRAAAIADFPAANWGKLKLFFADQGPNGYVAESDDTDYVPMIGPIYRDTTRKAIVCPASTFTAPAVSNSGGKVKLTGGGVHGLTTAVCITAGDSHINVSAGTNWTAGLYKITAITDGGNDLIIDLTYDAGLGSPTVTLANSGTDVVVKTITLPRLRATSKLLVDVSQSMSNTANAKSFKIKLGGTTFVSVSIANAASNGAVFAIYNRSLTTQIGRTSTAVSTGVGTAATAQPTASIDTGTGTAQLTLSYAPVAANEVCAIDVVDIELK